MSQAQTIEPLDAQTATADAADILVFQILVQRARHCVTSSSLAAGVIIRRAAHSLDAAGPGLVQGKWQNIFHALGRAKPQASFGFGLALLRSCLVRPGGALVTSQGCEPLEASRTLRVSPGRAAENPGVGSAAPPGLGRLTHSVPGVDTPGY